MHNLEARTKTVEELKKIEEVNHPLHYGGKDNPYEAIKVIEAWQLGFCLGNTVKYVARAGKKVFVPRRSDTRPTDLQAQLTAYTGEARESILRDLKKAQWYLNREIERLEASK